MDRVTLRQFTSSPHRYLDRVRSGESILLTDRGVTVMRLEPASRTDRSKSALDSFIAGGLLKPADALATPTDKNEADSE